MSEKTKELAVKTTEILPANIEAEIAKAIQAREALNKLFNNLLQQGTDFDRIPGTDKPTLLKPGGELLCQVFKLATGEPKIVNAIEDFDKGIFSYTISMPVIHRETGTLVATGIGSANSHEVKYKYRHSSNDDGEKIKVLNAEPADQQNTLVKMAAKRAFIDGVLKATGASRMFTQDVEDMPWLAAEKASSRQISYIKTFFKDMEDTKAFGEIDSIISRKPESWEDILRTEASQIIEAKKGGTTNKPKSTTTTTYTCVNCKTNLTQGVASFSKNKYGKHLCQKCQKEVENEPETTEDVLPPWEQVEE